MGHIKEPDGIDFRVDSKPLTGAERQQISEIIAHYKATGRQIKNANNYIRPKEATTDT